MAAARAAIDTGSMQTGTSKNTKVFIADDSASIRESLINLVSEIEGVSVVGVAESPAEAIAGIIDSHPDFVVLDIRLNGGSGMEVLEALEELGVGEAVVIFIVLTNYPDLQYRKACMEAGASYFLDKSTEFQRVAEIIYSLGAQGCRCDMTRH